MIGLFVTGTDTGVGKTIVTAGLALAFAARGHDVGVVKPVQSGAVASDPGGDAMLLKRWTGSAEPIDEIVPYAFAAPLAPLIAAQLEGHTVDRDHLVEHVRAVGSRHDVLLVEGAGGLVVPVGEDWTIADLALSLGLPLLIVARAGLGTVNHTALTVLAARSLGLEPVGVILNGPQDESTAQNAPLIERFAEIPVLGRIPWLEGELTGDRVHALVEKHVDIDSLVGVVASGARSG